MNTFFCDADSSDPADTVAVMVAIYLESIGWNYLVYRDRAFHDIKDGGAWCLSELVPLWIEGTTPKFNTPFHEGCRWQPD